MNLFPGIQLFVFCLSVAALNLPIRADAQDGAKTELRFVSFPKSIEPLSIELQLGEGKTVTIKAPSNEISAPISVPAQAVWVFGETKADEEGKPTFHVLGKAKSVESPSQILLLVRKGAEKSEGFEVLALDGRADRFGGGKFLFVNATRVKIGADVGERKFVIEPSGHQVIAPKSDGGLCHATLYFDKEGKARPFFSSKWPVNEAARAIIFIYHDPRSRKLRLHSLREFLE